MRVKWSDLAEPLTIRSVSPAVLTSISVFRRVLPQVYVSSRKDVCSFVHVGDRLFLKRQGFNNSHCTTSLLAFYGTHMSVDGVTIDHPHVPGHVSDHMRMCA